jgi:uncharacterized membrane protein YhaH (DUF805 family)
MNKTKFTPAQEKIYYDKSKLSDNVLLEIANSEGKYIQDVVSISKIILAERGLFSPEVIDEFNNDKNEKTEEIKRTSFNVDGPPYDRKFSSNSTTALILTFVVAVFYALAPGNDSSIQIAILVAMLILSVWAAVIAARYLKMIGQSMALAVICFLFPFIGLLIVRYLGYSFIRPEIKVIFSKAVEYFNYQSKQQKEDGKLTEGEKIENLKAEVNEKLNEKISDFLQWIENNGNGLRTQEEINAKVKAVTAEYEYEPEPLPVIDISFKIDEPETEPEPENIEEKESACPACGYKVSPEEKECPDCGINLE